MELLRYQLLGYYQDDKSPCYYPDDIGDYIKIKDRYLYRPISPDKIQSTRYRIRAIIKRLVLCNPVSWFTTLTHNDPAARKDFMKSLAAGSLYLRRLRDIKVKALLIPELDPRGNWHFHGFLFGTIPKPYLFRKKHIQTLKPISRYIKPLGRSLPVYASTLWEGGTNNLGYEFMTSMINLTPYETIKVIKYSGKYITKTLAEIKTRNHYLRSRGLIDDIDLMINKLFGVC
jgi:hypothetical protein